VPKSWAVTVNNFFAHSCAVAGRARVSKQTADKIATRTERVSEKPPSLASDNNASAGPAKLPAHAQISEGQQPFIY
jgi:hypothetical protein